MAEYLHATPAPPVLMGKAALGRDPSGNVYTLPLTAGGAALNIAGAGAGGTSDPDETTFTAGSTSGNPIMGVITPSDTPSSGALAVVALAADRSLKVSGSFSAGAVTSSTATAPSQTTLGTTAATALASNGSRKGFLIQNQGTTAIKVLLGTATPTQANYTIALPACGVANDGSSPAYYGPPGVLWTGAIQWISSAAGGLAEAIELT
jgi:hypothetical protein